MENFTNKVKDEKSKILNFEYEAAFFFAWLSKGIRTKINPPTKQSLWVLIHKFLARLYQKIYFLRKTKVSIFFLLGNTKFITIVGGEFRLEYIFNNFTLNLLIQLRSQYETLSL